MYISLFKVLFLCILIKLNMFRMPDGNAFFYGFFVVVYTLNPLYHWGSSLWSTDIQDRKDSYLSSRHCHLCNLCNKQIIGSLICFIQSIFTTDYLIIYKPSVGKESACNAGDPDWIPGSGRSPGEGIGYPLQYSRASLMVQLVKNLPAISGDLSSIHALGRSPGEGKGYPLQCFGQENSMDCIVHGVTKSHTPLSLSFFSQNP